MIQEQDTPSLFGLKYSNRDFSRREAWGKNQFNSSFPAALLAYMEHKDIEPVYIYTNTKSEVQHKYISVKDLLGINAKDEDTYYAFESTYTPYAPFIQGLVPRVDLVIQRRSDGGCLRGLEIKMTALPDNSTCTLDESLYSSEIVVRPDTISYLACSIVSCHRREKLSRALSALSCIVDWTDERELVVKYETLVQCALNLALLHAKKQRPLIVQPIWKTEGKSPRLACDCLDVFVWSDLSVLHLFVAFTRKSIRSIGRHERTLVWLLRMLWDYACKGQFCAETIIDTLSFNTKNDKAFSSNGHITHPYLCSPHLAKPRICKNEIRHIILGGGQHLLSPERRFDAILFNSPDIFE